jgi:hypothetical protein
MYFVLANSLVASMERFSFKKKTAPPVRLDDAVSVIAETVHDEEIGGVAERVEEIRGDENEDLMEFDDPCDLVDLMDELEREERDEPSVATSASYHHPGLGLGGSQW